MDSADRRISECRSAAARGAGNYGKHTLSIARTAAVRNGTASPIAGNGRICYNCDMCWYCGSPIEDEEPLGRSLRCSACGKDLRVCRHCRFYLPGSRGDCSESSADAPGDKERANFCDWFSLDSRFRSNSAGEKEEQDRVVSARTAFDNLFK
jgi:hypothetical protein